MPKNSLPESISWRGGGVYKPKYGPGWPSRVSMTANQRGASASPGDDELPPGSLIARLNAADILSSDAPIKISNFQCIASYNWLDSCEPIILVPGMPLLHRNPDWP